MKIEDRDFYKIELDVKLKRLEDELERLELEAD